MKRIWTILLICIFLSCSAYSEESQDDFTVVCTSFPCYDLVRAVSGIRADVRLLIRPGAEVHSFEPTPTDILTIANCDLFVYIGGESDVWVDSILESLDGDAPKTLRLFECVEALEEERSEEMTFHESHAEEEEEIEYDEHIWTSPKNAIRMLDAIEETLMRLCPERAASFQTNSDFCREKISELDAAFEDVVRSAKQKTVVFADRFPLLYFVREYGLDYAAAFPSCTSEAEPSAHTVAALIDRINAEKIPVIFKLELSSGRIAETIAEETGVEIRTFYSIQNVSETDFRRNETYVTLMERNLRALKEALN